MSGEWKPPGYQADFTDAEYLEFREILRELGRGTGVFDANDALAAIFEGRSAQRATPLNAGDVVTILRDMEDLGYIRSVERDPPNGPARWEYIGD